MCKLRDRCLETTPCRVQTRCLFEWRRPRRGVVALSLEAARYACRSATEVRRDGDASRMRSIHSTRSISRWLMVIRSAQVMANPIGRTRHFHLGPTGRDRIIQDYVAFLLGATPLARPIHLTSPTARACSTGMPEGAVNGGRRPDVQLHHCDGLRIAGLFGLPGSRGLRQARGGGRGGMRLQRGVLGAGALRRAGVGLANPRLRGWRYGGKNSRHVSSRPEVAHASRSWERSWQEPLDRLRGVGPEREHGFRDEVHAEHPAWLGHLGTN